MVTFLSLRVGLVLGTLFYFWDNKKGYSWYKRWYDLSHKEPLETTDVYSFVNNQPFSKRLIPAIIIAVAFSYLTWLLGDINLIITLLTGALSLVGILVGFYLGPLILKKLPKGFKEAKKTLDKIDSLEQDLTNKSPKPISEPTPEPEKKSPPKKDDDDWRKGVKDFLDK
jgi:hypothetical protein